MSIEPNETELVRKLVKPDWVCLDIGANEGYYTVLMAKQCKAVFAFEAEPVNNAILKHNIQDFNNIIDNPYVVSDRDGWEKLYLCSGDYNGAKGMHRIYPSKWCIDTPISVPSVTIDYFLEYEYIKINFIKMDIEGSEYGALKGMRKLLNRDKPIILMEFHPPSIEEYGADPQEEYHFLKTLGYEVTLVPDIKINNYKQLDQLTRDESGGKNILCN